MQTKPLIYTTLDTLWRTYSGGKTSGRFPCPVIAYVARGAAPFVATHIYRGYGATRLERIEGQPVAKKGFQGEVMPLPYRIHTDFLIED